MKLICWLAVLMCGATALMGQTSNTQTVNAGRMTLRDSGGATKVDWQGTSSLRGLGGARVDLYTTGSSMPTVQLDGGTGYINAVRYYGDASFLTGLALASSPGSTTHTLFGTNSLGSPSGMTGYYTLDKWGTPHKWVWDNSEESWIAWDEGTANLERITGNIAGSGHKLIDLQVENTNLTVQAPLELSAHDVITTGGTWHHERPLRFETPPEYRTVYDATYTTGLQIMAGGRFMPPYPGWNKNAWMTNFSVPLSVISACQGYPTSDPVGGTSISLFEIRGNGDLYLGGNGVYDGAATLIHTGAPSGSYIRWYKHGGGEEGQIGPTGVVIGSPTLSASNLDIRTAKGIAADDDIHSEDTVYARKALVVGNGRSQHWDAGVLWIESKGTTVAPSQEASPLPGSQETAMFTDENGFHAMNKHALAFQGSRSNGFSFDSHGLFAGDLYSSGPMRENGQHVPNVSELVSGHANVSVAVATSTVTIGLTGAIPIANGGTGQTSKAAAFDGLSPTTTIGDLSYRGASANVRLSGNVTTATKYLTQVGTGLESAAPVWAPLVWDLSDGHASGDLSASGTLAVTGKSYLYDSLEVGGDATLTGTLHADGDTETSGTLAVTGKVYLYDGLQVGGTLTTSGTTELEGVTAYGNGHMAGNLGTSGTLAVTDRTDIYGALVVIGAGAFEGALSAAASLSTSGTLETAGAIDYGTAHATGNLSTSGTLAATGRADVYGAATVGGTLDVATTLTAHTTALTTVTLTLGLSCPVPAEDGQLWLEQVTYHLLLIYLGNGSSGAGWYNVGDLGGLRYYDEFGTPLI